MDSVELDSKVPGDKLRLEKRIEHCTRAQGGTRAVIFPQLPLLTSHECSAPVAALLSGAAS